MKIIILLTILFILALRERLALCNVLLLVCAASAVPETVFIFAHCREEWLVSWVFPRDLFAKSDMLVLVLMLIWQGSATWSICRGCVTVVLCVKSCCDICGHGEMVIQGVCSISLLGEVILYASQWLKRFGRSVRAYWVRASQAYDRRDIPVTMLVCYSNMI
jgi:hypothetical protein